MVCKTFRRQYLIMLCGLLIAIFISHYIGFALPVLGDSAVQVYVGGTPIGLVIKPKGVIVVGVTPIETELGRVTIQTPLLHGDIIESINECPVDSAEDIRSAVKNTNDMTVRLGIRRGTASFQISSNLIKEDLTGEKRLGLQVRENIAGVGTITYIHKDGRFACLGHPIALENGNMVPCDRGASFSCKILGCNKGIRGKAGELKGAFSESVPNGKVYRNCGSGVYGMFDDFPFSDEMLIEVANRQNVTIGKAYIIATVGETTDKYSIEIIKTASQNSASDKSMILRVTDKRLIAATGGIVQGMSGSPIIQNNKLVGAVTHVFISDPTKGYGIYADWMLQND